MNTRQRRRRKFVKSIILGFHVLIAVGYVVAMICSLLIFNFSPWTRCSWVVENWFKFSSAFLPSQHLHFQPASSISRTNFLTLEAYFSISFTTTARTYIFYRCQRWLWERRKRIKANKKMIYDDVELLDSRSRFFGLFFSAFPILVNNAGILSYKKRDERKSVVFYYFFISFHLNFHTIVAKWES